MRSRCYISRRRLAAYWRTLNCSSLIAAVVALAGLTAPGCGDGPAPPEIEGWSCEYQDVLFPRRGHALDLLIVVDTAPAMAAYHAALVDNLARFAWVLANQSGGLPSIHLGVIAGDGDGRLLSAATTEGCPTPDGRFVTDVELPWWWCSADPSQPCRERNADAPLDDVLVCIAGLDAVGDRATPLAAAVRALDGSHPENQGFLRDRSLLGIVFLTATDDDSPAAVDDYADQLLALAGDPGRLALAAAMPEIAPRLRSLLDRFPQRSTMTSITVEDWSDLLILFAGPFEWPCCNCLERADPTDLDPDQPGIQPECWVSEIEGEPPSLVPGCTMLTPTRPDPDSPLPCWWVEPAADCGLLGHFEQREVYGGASVEIRCATPCP